MPLSRSIGARKDATRGTAALEVRKGLAWLFSGPGVLPGADSPLVTGTSGWAYSVGKAGFVSTRGASDGVHLFGNDGAVTIGATGVGSTVPVAPGSGLQRIDIIWVLHPSASENSDTTSQPVFGVTSGTAASSALAPTIPVGALELGRNLMQGGASTTSTSSAGNSITQTAARAALAFPQSGSTASASSVGPTVDTTPLAVMTAPTVVGDGARKFKVTASIRTATGTVATDFYTFTLVEILSGATVAQFGCPLISTSAGIFSPPLVMVATHVPPAGARAYRLDMVRTAGTGTLTAVGRMEIIVEQIA